MLRAAPTTAIVDLERKPPILWIHGTHDAIVGDASFFDLNQLGKAGLIPGWSGCDIVRVAVPSRDDAEALPIIAEKSQIPVIADIHFQSNYVFAAIDAGCAAVRVNPGNIRKYDVDRIRYRIVRRLGASGRCDLPSLLRIGRSARAVEGVR